MKRRNNGFPYAIQNADCLFLGGIFGQQPTWGPQSKAYFYMVKQIAEDVAKQVGGRVVYVG